METYQIKSGFVLRQIAGEYLLVPVTMKRQELILLNEVSASIWEMLKEACTFEELLNKVTSQFEVREETAARDIRTFLEEMRHEGLLV